jgi:hypothetical protein
MRKETDIYYIEKDILHLFVKDNTHSMINEIIFEFVGGNQLLQSLNSNGLLMMYYIIFNKHTYFLTLYAEERVKDR